MPVICADLHVHSDFSDSSLSIAQTLARAERSGLTHLSLVDHDTVAGTSQARELATLTTIQIIPGIEISAQDRSTGKKVHILGYAYQTPASNLTTLCQPTLQRRTQKTLSQVDILIQAGFPLSRQAVLDKAGPTGAIYKQHIMAVLIDLGITDSVYSDLYRTVFKGAGICAGDIDYVDVQDAIAAVRADGGIPVLAHPGQSKVWESISGFAREGLTGIELNHPDHDSSDYGRIRDLADQYDFLLTGGSDYHADYGNGPDIGQVLAPAESLLQMQLMLNRHI